jgi:hypothetical protein
MHRRALLVAVAGLSGCTGLVPLGGGAGSTGQAGGSAGETGDSGNAGGSQEGTATATPAGTPSDGTPSADALRRMDVPALLDRARDQTDRAVDAYAGDGGSLTAVTAATTTFDPTPAIEHLYNAQAAYEAANRQGISAEQEQTIQRLRRVKTLLRLAIDAQSLLVQAHIDLEEFVDAVEYVDAESVGSISDRVATRSERATAVVSELSQRRYAQSVGVVDRLSRAEYDDKRLQLETEAEVLDRLFDALGGVIEGVRLLSQARRKRRSGAPYAAARLARDAESRFVRGRTSLDSVAGSIPPQGQGFAAVAAALVAAADDRRVEAREFYEGIA